MSKNESKSSAAANPAVQRFFKKYFALLICVVIVLALLIAYYFGYRVGPGLSIGQVGKVTLTELPNKTSIFVDQELKQTTSKAENVTIELVPGTHTIIVSAPNDYPWSTNVAIVADKTITTEPILVSTSLGGKALTGAAKTAALAAIASTMLPTQTAPLMVAGGCALVYVENNQIIEDPATSTPSCTPPPYLCVNGTCNSTVIFAPLAKIDDVLPFPGHDNAVVILIDHSLYALGLDPRDTQFFAPIAHGHLPTAGELPDGTIVISDGGAVSSISF